MQTASIFFLLSVIPDPERQLKPIFLSEFKGR